MKLPENHPGKALYAAIEKYSRTHPQQSGVAARLMAFIESTDQCFERGHTSGHITGSAWLLNPAQDKVLLTLHRKLKRWMQPGGHADGDSDTLRVAIREAEEESGICGIVPVSCDIYDIDIHLIPERPASGEPAHWHYDIRYLLRAPHETYAISNESDDLAWWSAQDFIKKRAHIDDSVLRMAQYYPTN